MSNEDDFTYQDYVVSRLDNNDPQILLNKSIALYGASHSGKSIIMKNMIYTLRNIVPNIIVIAPPASAEFYAPFVPKQLIHNMVSEELLKDIFERQKMITSLYKTVNDYDNLFKIFNKISTIEQMQMLKNLDETYRTLIDRIDNKISDKIKRKQKTDKLYLKHSKGKLKYIKRILNKYGNVSELDQTDQKIIKYLNVNPNILVVCDDCAYDKDWKKMTTIRELMMNGRHANITFIVSIQYDKLFPPELRSNVRINIFTKHDSVVHFLKNDSFTPDEKKITLGISAALFKQNNEGNNFKKFVFMSEEADQLRYYLADYVMEDFMFGSKQLIKMCDSIGKKDSSLTILDKFQ